MLHEGEDEEIPTEAHSGDLDRTLASLAQLLPGAVYAMVDLRDRLATCWPTRPSLRVLPPAERGLFKSSMRLVAGGPWEWGELYRAIEAANNTLDAHGRAVPSGDALGRWSLGRVDPAAEPIPAPAAAAALRAAIPVAEATRDGIHRRLDEITTIAPPETRLPAWTIDDAQPYIDAAKWRHARPNQPPHEYTIRAWRPDMRHDFLAFAQLIQSQGVVKTWGEYVHAYLEVDGLEYWTMGARVPETTVVNRAPVNAPAAAKPLPSDLDDKVLHAVERALAYRRMELIGGAVPTGTLGERLRALYQQAQKAE